MSKKQNKTEWLWWVIGPCEGTKCRSNRFQGPRVSEPRPETCGGEPLVVPPQTATASPLQPYGRIKALADVVKDLQTRGWALSHNHVPGKREQSRGRTRGEDNAEVET